MGDKGDIAGRAGKGYDPTLDQAVAGGMARCGVETGSVTYEFQTMVSDTMELKWGAPRN